MFIFVFIFLFLLIVYAVLIDYYRRAWNKLPTFTGADLSPRTTISLIIAVRNEENNIKPLLDSLCLQSYPSALTEFIIVDDHSEDNTWNLLKNYPTVNRRFSFIQLADHLNKEDSIVSHKKKAIETGISQAMGTLIVTTDADCLFHADWLLTIARFYETHSAKFIAAPVKIASNRSLLSIFQTLDFLTLQGITGASVYKRIHSMCNGANLAYEKAAFNEVGGFSGIDNLPSGDDMLLMHKIYKKYPQQVFYLKHESAIVSTTPVSSWKSFFHQRIRWASKADSYDDKRIFWVLLLVYGINLFFLALGVAAFFHTTWGFFLLLFLLAKVLIEFPFVNTVASFFRQRMLLNYFILMQPLHILYTIIAGWLGKFGSFEWKGRRTNVK